MTSVVNISTTQTVVTNVNPFPFEFPPGSPFEDMFKEFGTPQKRKASALGSGFIIDAKGIVITNNHVIKGAINTHKKDTTRKTPLDIYNQWESWQKDICRIMIPRAVLEMFGKNGYEIDMMNISKCKPVYSEAKHDFTPGVCLADYLAKHHPSHHGLQLITG